MNAQTMLVIWTVVAVAALSSSAVVQAQSPEPPRCELAFWIFDTLEHCNEAAGTPPSAMGTLYADEQCHAMVPLNGTDASPLGVNDAVSLLFPGHYRAVCTSNGMLRFLDSGCTSDTCDSSSSSATTMGSLFTSTATATASASTSTSSSSSTTAFADTATTACDRDNGSIASLYSRLDVPEFIVQIATTTEESMSSSLAVGGYDYTCLRLQGANGESVTFAIFGDCLQAECQPSDGGGTDAEDFTVEAAGGESVNDNDSSGSANSDEMVHNGGTDDSSPTTAVPPSSTTTTQQSPQSGADNIQRSILYYPLLLGVLVPLASVYT